MNERRDADVIILGSGFAASLLAAILSREGMAVVMVDRSRHPRFAIGESSTPAADLLLKVLVDRHDLSELRPLVSFGSWRSAYPQLPCGCKRGFSYFWHGADEGFQATADHRHELLVAANASREVADTQWYRPELDQFLVAAAQNRGAVCLQAAEVVGIEHPREHRWQVTVNHERRSKQLRAPLVVDATGPAGALMRRLAIPDWSDQLATRSSAVYGHWHDVRPLAEWLEQRGAATDEHPFPAGDAAVHHLFRDGWLWQLAFEGGLTSLGFVFAGGPPPGANISPERLWSDVLKAHPVLREVIGSARLARFPGRLYRTGRLQRLWSAGAGADWAALPFTVGFVDPLHSTGIAHSLTGVDRISRILLGESGDDRARRLAEYSRHVTGELRHIDRLVAGCYAGLGDFRGFTAWSMVYFAAATTFEKRWWADPDRKPGFLCADDAEFVRRVSDLFEFTARLGARTGSGEPRDPDELLARVRDAIAPYNHVGLFAPPVPNMYHHTAAAK